MRTPQSQVHVWPLETDHFAGSEACVTSQDHDQRLTGPEIDQAGEVIPSFLNEPCVACPPSDGRSPAPPGMTWTSRNERVARVSYADGTERLDRAEDAMLSGVPTWRKAHVYATGPGAATVVATAFGLSDEIQVTVPEIVLPAPRAATHRSSALTSCETAQPL